ncbi:hypothetical protein PsgB076_27910 [Pseudomonas savastanoi pv. glycinea str. B076]|nr:hypothetical protein PsgB076_27910 [Pseudomonas savastanoi pv. glycinea str. B076]
MNMSKSVARFQIARVQAEIVGGAVFVHCPECNTLNGERDRLRDSPELDLSTYPANMRVYACVDCQVMFETEVPPDIASE